MLWKKKAKKQEAAEAGQRPDTAEPADVLKMTEIAEVSGNAGTGRKKLKFPKKKWKLPKKRWIALGIIGIIVAGSVLSSVFGPEQLPTVSVQNAQVGTIEQSLNLSGTVKSAVQKTYFSPLTAKIDQCQVHTGDIVEAGQVLVSYDAEDLEYRKQEAQLQSDEAYYSYQDSVSKNNKQASEYSRSSHDVSILEQQVEEAKATVQALQQNIADLNCFLTDANRDGETDYAAQLQNTITQRTSELGRKQDELAEYESDLAEQKGIQSSSENAVLTSAGKKQIEATKDLAALKAEQISGAVDQVRSGLTAEFAGVVTEVKVTDGAEVADGDAMMTVESSEDVYVEISLGKNDLQKVQEGNAADITIGGKTYQGTVTSISHNAEKNEKGATIIKGRIGIDNPDSDIFLGVEAKILIHGAQEENAVLIPIAAVNVGQDGSFVYIVENGVVEERLVETGITSSEMVEITSGLDGSEQIVTGAYGITAGMKVTPVEE